MSASTFSRQHRRPTIKYQEVFELSKRVQKNVAKCRPNSTGWQRQTGTAPATIIAEIVTDNSGDNVKTVKVSEVVISRKQALTLTN